MNNLFVDSITKAYGSRRILTDIVIDIKEGEVVALFGRNGSGKSTLMKVIYGIESAPTKYIRFNDKIVTDKPKNKIINYLPQKSCLPTNLRVETILNLWKKHSDIDSLLQLKKVRELQCRRIKHLSWGEKRFFEIALFCYSHAPFILLDEPFNGLSPILINDIKEIIYRKSSVKGFLISDHDYQNVLDISNKLILLDQGCTKYVKEKSDLQEIGYLP